MTDLIELSLNQNHTLTSTLSLIQTQSGWYQRELLVYRHS